MTKTNTIKIPVDNTSAFSNVLKGSLNEEYLLSFVANRNNVKVTDILLYPPFIINPSCKVVTLKWSLK